MKADRAGIIRFKVGGFSSRLRTVKESQLLQTLFNSNEFLCLKDEKHVKLPIQKRHKTLSILKQKIKLLVT